MNVKTQRCITFFRLEERKIENPLTYLTSDLKFFSHARKSQLIKCGSRFNRLKSDKKNITKPN